MLGNAHRPAVLLMGAVEHHEFGAARRWLRAHTRLDLAAGAEEALGRLARRTRPWQTVVFAQARPGQLPARDVDRIGRAVPLAHLVALLGSCCEGETRSGRPWPGVTRVFWHQWEARCRQEPPGDILPSTWQLPRTASELERTVQALAAPPPPATGLVAIVTRRASLFHGLAAACRVAGYSAVWKTSPTLRDVDGVVAVLWEGATMDDGELEQLRQIGTVLARIPVIALLGFPRYDMVQRAQRCGVRAVLSIPCLLPDLWSTLRAVTREPPGR
jgi:hypothetical protein